MSSRTVWLKPWMVSLPSLPNFLREVTNGFSLDIADLDDEVLQNIGQQWTKALLERAAVRRQQKKAL